MTIRNLDSAGDWTFGQGRQNYLRDERAIELNVQTRLACFLNDCFWQMDFGVDWWNLLGAKGPTAESAIVLQCRTSIAGAFGVVRIGTVRPTIDARTRRLVVRYVIDTIFTRNLVGSATATT